MSDSVRLSTSCPLYIELHTGTAGVSILQSELHICPFGNIAVHSDPGSHTSLYPLSITPSPHREISYLKHSLCEYKLSLDGIYSCLTLSYHTVYSTYKLFGDLTEGGVIKWYGVDSMICIEVFASIFIQLFINWSVHLNVGSAPLL